MKIIDNIGAAVSDMDGASALCLEMYFGLVEHEFTIAEIADELGLSIYMAKKNILIALERLIVKLKVSGLLNEKN